MSGELKLFLVVPFEHLKHTDVYYAYTTHERAEEDRQSYNKPEDWHVVSIDPYDNTRPGDGAVSEQDCLFMLEQAQRGEENRNGLEWKFSHYYTPNELMRKYRESKQQGVG